jgi:erythromycin esterase
MIGLGEGTHGTHEFGVVRTRLIQNLAEMGLTDVLFEASLPDALAVDEYVQGGAGNPEALLHAMGFWLHEHEAVVELVTWLRAWNHNPAHRRKIHFRGIDNPFPAGALECVRRYAAGIGVAVSLPDSASAPFLYARNRPALLRAYAQADTAAVGRATTALAAVVAAMSAWNAPPEGGVWVSLPVARKCAEVAAQAHARYARRGGNLAARDSIMAVNALWWVAHSGPGGKGVVWAHNYHVAADTMATTGAFLRRALGDRYSAVALLFDRGEVLTRPWPEAATDPFRERQEPPAILSVAATQGPLIEHALRATGKGSLTLDLRRDAMPAAVARFLGTPVWSRDFGEWFGPTDTGLFQYTFGRAFDALVFLDSATASRLTPTAAAMR